ncbi:MAG: hypothetical protein PF487_13700 [Bacteroidales bacterium]|jgi:hypothetical protein|nr:hypothetical protein [Bacteroidales bacterium]
MAITTKRPLINSKFKQASGGVLDLYGDTKFYGFLSLINGNQGVGNVLVSNANGSMDWEIRGVAGGLATLDSGSQLAHNIDAGKITTGTISLARIPHSAIERLEIVTDETARFNLTTTNVQNGDTVKQNDTGLMYFVVDETNLGNPSGYQIYNAGSAASVEWNNIQNKPTDLTDLSTHSSTELNDITDAGSGSIISSIERTKLDNIEDGAEVNVQSDWNQATSSADDFIKNKPNLSTVATTNNYYDLDNLPAYQIIVVNNETEFLDATIQLSGTSGTILLNNDIVLTADRTVDLHNVTVNGNRNAIDFNSSGTSYKLIINSNTRQTYFGNLQLMGNTLSTEGVEEIMVFEATGGTFVFNSVVFRYLSMFDTYNTMVASTTSNIVFSGNVNLFLESCTTLSASVNAYYPIFFTVNPGNDTQDYLHVKITAFGNVRRESYIGFRGKPAQINTITTGDPLYNDITHDGSIPILEGTNFIEIPSNVLLRKGFWMGTQTEYDNLSTYDPNTIYYIT